MMYFICSLPHQTVHSSANLALTCIQNLVTGKEGKERNYSVVVPLFCSPNLMTNPHMPEESMLEMQLNCYLVK